MSWLVHDDADERMGQDFLRDQQEAYRKQCDEAEAWHLGLTSSPCRCAPGDRKWEPIRDPDGVYTECVRCHGVVCDE